MSQHLRNTSIASIGDALMNLLDAQMRLGSELVDSLTRSKLPAIPSCCDIPEPCWMPQFAGEVVSHVCPGGSVGLELTVTNCDRIERAVTITARGAAAGQVSIVPTTLALGPKERGTSSLTLKIPSNACEGDEFEALIWVYGCRDHFVRWIGHVGKRAGACHHEIGVDDCPDLIHHWYDHFYCHRPCYGRGRTKAND